ncbi:MAG: GGDEF domain-containing protein, partial [Candidatus Omnitrophica bacterium]|nr:GGDEF domain-containing protein [Candidatus Omnitrophota bacterium]
NPVGVRGIVEEMPDIKIKKNKEREVPDLPSMDDEKVKNFNNMIYDPLTGLYNYQYFMTSLCNEIKRVEWMFRPMCMMMIDIDNFSALNDKIGKPQGDILLKKFAGVLKETLRPGDIICHQAQDQFLAIL